MLLIIKNSFFHEVAEILQKYNLPTLCQLVTCNQSKLQWKHICTRAINSFWTDHLNSEIKTKKTLKFLPVKNLRIGSTHLVWKAVETSVVDVKKAIVKARVLTGTYILQKTNRLSVTGLWMQFVVIVDWEKKTFYTCCRVAQHSTEFASQLSYL